jgi:hypothetical protein
VKESALTAGSTLEDSVLEPITLHELIDAQRRDPFRLSTLSELDVTKIKRLFAVSEAREW